VSGKIEVGGTPAPHLLTSGQVAQRYGIPRGRVNADISAGRLKATRFVPKGAVISANVSPYYIRAEDAEAWWTELYRGDGLLTVEAACRRAQCDRNTITRAVREGRLAVAATVFGYPRFEKADIDLWAREHLEPGPRRQGRPRRKDLAAA
jgi:predicted DNA-binding protein (UPF0251 family)